jgi:fused signal recognition particle receptor
LYVQVVLAASAPSHAALARAQLAAAWQQPDAVSHPLDQWAPQTDQLQAQLMVSEAERQRLQQQYDALSINHEALTTRCAQLEAALASCSKIACNDTSSSDFIRSRPSDTDAVIQQLEGMRQQLAVANRSLAQQQETNKQQAEQLQQALGDLAAERVRAQAAVATASTARVQLQQALQANLSKGVMQQGPQRSAARVKGKQALQTRHEAVQQELANLQGKYQQLQKSMELVSSLMEWKNHKEQHEQKSAAAEAAARRAQLNEAAALQAMAHMANQLDASRKQTSRARLQVVKGQKALAAAAAETDAARQRAQAAEHQTRIREVRIERANLLYRDLCTLHRNKMLAVKPVMQDARERRKQAEHGQRQLLVEVARLRRELQLQGSDSSSIFPEGAMVTRLPSVVRSHPIEVEEGQEVKQNKRWGFSRLWSWAAR